MLELNNIRRVIFSSDTELETAILQAQLWTEWTPYENPDPSILTDAAQLMFTRYNSHGSVQDLHAIIALHRRVIDIMSLRGVRHFVSLNDLAEALCERWYQQTRTDDIEESVSLFEEALALCTGRDERRAIILGNLAQALVYLNMQNAEVSRSSSAISLLREALAIAPLQNDVLAVLKMRLCRALVGNYTTSGGTFNDIQEAIDVSRSATSLLPIGHRDRPEVLLSLGRALDRMGEKEPGGKALDGVEEVRLLWYQILDIQSPTHPRRALCLSALGHRIRVLGGGAGANKSDYDEGIRLMRQATILVTPSHMLYTALVNNLCLGLTGRFARFHENREDLDDSIEFQEQAMNARALSDRRRHTNVHNLAIALEIRYKHFGNQEDLHRAICLGHEALALCPPGHAHHMFSVEKLSRRLILDPNCSVTKIDEMVGLLEAVLGDEFKPEGNRSAKLWLMCAMAQLLYTRFLRLNDSKDRARFADLFEAAVDDQSSSFGNRFKAAKEWITAAESLGSPEMAMKAYRKAIHISPDRIHPGLDLSSQLDQLKLNLATISCDAACCALVTADASEALTLLEQGRATFWAQRLKLRMSFDGLPSDLAERLRSATESLQEYHSLKRAHNALGEQRLLEQRLQHEAFEQLLQEARMYPGFTDLLRPMHIEQLGGLAKEGPLIVLLSSKTYGSFAIIIRDHSSQAEKLPLSSVTAGDLQAMVDELQVSVRRARQKMRDAADEGFERLKMDKGKSGPKSRTPDTMARLWSKVGEPIVHHLGIEVSTQQTKPVIQPVTQTVLSDARRSMLGREYGGAVLVYSLRCPSMQLEYHNPTQYTCQITSSHHTYPPSAVLSRQENTRLLLQQRLR
jgi:tetratricopeptide (TPR) repeat protein